MHGTDPFDFVLIIKDLPAILKIADLRDQAKQCRFSASAFPCDQILPPGHKVRADIRQNAKTLYMIGMMIHRQLLQGFDTFRPGASHSDFLSIML